jgi:hypothetical protein
VGTVVRRFAVLPPTRPKSLSVGKSYRIGKRDVHQTDDLWPRFSNRISKRPLRTADPLPTAMRSPGRWKPPSRLLFFFIARIPNRIALQYATGWPRPSRSRHSRSLGVVPPIHKRIVRSGADRKLNVSNGQPSLHHHAALRDGPTGFWGVTESEDKKGAYKLMGSDAPSALIRINEAFGST